MIGTSTGTISSSSQAKKDVSFSGMPVELEANTHLDRLMIGHNYSEIKLDHMALKSSWWNSYTASAFTCSSLADVNER